MNANQIIHGDNIEVLKSYPDNSIDSIVTDAPYGLGKEPDPVKVMKAWAECGHYDVAGKGFMNKKWDAFIPQPAFWKECYRVLKPGGHVLCFFGTRTYDWGVMAMRFAGFEVRDCLQWIYGSGFPKSLDISKAIDKELGAERENGTLAGKSKKGGGTISTTGMSGGEYYNSDPVSDEAKQYHGYGTALKPAVEPIVLARKPISEKTIAANVLKWGTGGLNIDGCRIKLNGIEEHKTAGRGQGHGSDIYNYPNDKQKNPVQVEREEKGENPRYNSSGRFPSNVIFDEEAAELLDKQSGVLTSGHMESVSKGTNYGIYGKFNGRPVYAEGDTGGASRFFYIAKAPSGEREQGVRWMKKAQGGSYRFREDGSLAAKANSQRANTHPTVKPISLMQHLVRLITPPGGICVDPFAGSGTTCIACKLENLQYIGIEMDAEYVNIAQERIKAYATQLKIF